MTGGERVDFATKSAMHYDAIASHYDQHLTGDTWIRSAFHALVAQYVPSGSGSVVVDFGCGTGTDALWYAQNGLRVFACDVSAGMVAELEKKCQAEITQGLVFARHGEYSALLKVSFPDRPSAVLCNFGVLSLIPDLPGVFAAFADFLAPGGYVIANNLNPLFWRELASPWYWKYMIRSMGKGGVLTHGPKCDTSRYLVSTLDAAAKPHFRRLMQAGVDSILSRAACRNHWSAPASLAQKLEKKLWKAPLFRSFGRYVFVVYRRL